MNRHWRQTALRIGTSGDGPGRNVGADPLGGESIPAGVVLAEVDGIVGSGPFAHSDRLRRFLRFVVERALQGRAVELKESVLAVEVFDRQPTYNSHVDSIVRVEARRLRDKLQKYYETEGQASGIRIELPKGSYVPVFRKLDVQPLWRSVAAWLGGKRQARRMPADLARTGLTVPILIAALVVLATAAATWWLTASRGTMIEPTLRRLTSDTGLTYQPALCLRTKLLAYASDRAGDGGLDIWVQPIEGGQPIRLTDDPANDLEPEFSPDGRTIAYRSERAGGGVYLVPASGGKSTKLAAGGIRPRFSPDGRLIAYWMGEKHFRKAQIFLVNATGGAPVPFVPEFRYAAYPIWSPKGDKLLFVGDSGREGEGRDWWLAPLSGGQAVKTGARQVFQNQGISAPERFWGARSIAPSVWMRGDYVVFSAFSGDRTNIWRVRISAGNAEIVGPAERLTFGAGREDYVSGAGEERLAFSVMAEKSDIWRLPLDADGGTALGSPVPLTNDAANNIWPQVSSDGKLFVYLANRAGNYDLIARETRGSRERMLTATKEDEFWPVISADGSRVAFGRRSGSKRSIFVTQTAGGDPVLLCDDCGEPRSWSGDGHSLLYQQDRLGFMSIGLVDPSGIRPDLIRSPGGSLYSPRFAPAGDWIAFVSRTPPDVHRVFLVPFRNGRAAARDEWIAVTETGQWVDKPRWSPNGNILYFLSDRDGFTCIWAQRLSPAGKRPNGDAAPIWHFHDRRQSLGNSSSMELSIARNGALLTLNESTGNVWIVERRGGH